MTKLTFPRTASKALEGSETLLVLAPRKALARGWHKKILPAGSARVIETLRKSGSPGPLGWVGGSYEQGRPRRIVLGMLPDAGSRHNTPTRLEAILRCTQRAALGSGPKTVLAFAEDRSRIKGVAAGVWRAFPLYDRKTGGKSGSRSSRLAFLALDPEGKPLAMDAATRAVIESGRWAARLVDTPTAELDTAAFVVEARKLVAGLPHVKTRVIGSDGLVKQGLLGIHSVGRAAATGPRLLILDYKPPRARRTIGLVGKGVVYDTGGLNIKVAGHMSTMKADMGGAAAVVGAFSVLARNGCKDRIVALAPLAENAVGPRSYRPDDIITMHSGLTVEINNTDAEGRLLLADGVSYVARKYEPDAVIDAATLTGAQLIATGHRHAAVVSNREGFERTAVEAGRETGDLTWPLPFAPEFYQAEFTSRVADMRNSVKDRMNAQSSCAAQFVYRHIQDLDVPWLHIDLAGPAHRNQRATGFGVALIAGIVERLTAAALKR